MSEEKYIFETKDDIEHKFDTEDQMLEFATSLTIKNMAEEGLGEIVIIDGEENFKINEKGLQFLKDNNNEVVH